MISNKDFLKILQKNSIKFFTGVPDSLLKEFLGYLNENISYPNHITAANEGNAIALAIGSFLATGNIPLVYLQNSGLGNTINPLLSLADNSVYGIPMLLLIGWRGKPGVKDEPQHYMQGLTTERILEAIKIPYFTINSKFSKEDMSNIVRSATNKAISAQQPFAILVEKDTFEDFQSKTEDHPNHLISREEALEICLEKLTKKDIIVSTTGMLSRELYELREKKFQGHSNDFLTVGGMGHANQIALGIALNKPERNIYCFDGDGAILMHMGSIALNGSLKLKNYKHILFNNNVHDSVGGQATSSQDFSFSELAKIAGYKFTSKTSLRNEILELMDEIRNNQESSFIEISIRKGARKNLSRPKSSPRENKNDFIKQINE